LQASFVALQAPIYTFLSPLKSLPFHHSILLSIHPYFLAI